MNSDMASTDMSSLCRYLTCIVIVFGVCLVSLKATEVCPRSELDRLANVKNIEYFDDKSKSFTLVRITCEENADLVPDDDVFCLNSGEWNEVPRCLSPRFKFNMADISEFLERTEVYPYAWYPNRKRALQPACNERSPLKIYFKNGTKIEGEKWFRHGEVAQFSCVDGYELYRDCHRLNETFVQSGNDNGVWKPPVPECKEKRCNIEDIRKDYMSLIYESSGEKVQTDMIESGSVIIATCQETHQFVKKSTLEQIEMYCIKGSMRNVIKCEKVKSCRDINHPENGRRLDRNNKPQTTTHFECDEGFRMIGSNTMYCREDGTWREKSPPTCEIIKCRDIEHPEHGRRLDRNNKPQTTTHFECDEGFRMIGSNTMYCREDGTWRKESPPFCEIIKCRDIGHPENGRRLDSNNKPRTTTRFECDEGYRMIGSSTMDCRGDGTWRMESPPICEIVCGPPAGIEYAELADPKWKTKSDFNDDDTIIYRCKEGRRMNGIGSITCLNGEWSNPTFTCTVSTCPPLYNFENGDVTYSETPIETGTIAFIKCKEHADLVPSGADTISCLTFGNWNVFPRCLKKCLTKDNPNYHYFHTNGVKVKGVYAESGLQIKAKCNVGYTFKNKEDLLSINISCLKGKWLDTIPCEPKRCRVKNVANGRNTDENGTTAEGLVEHGTVIETTCDNKYQVEYNKKGRNKCDKGRLDSPKCEGQSCPLPATPDHTRYSYSKSNVKTGHVRHGEKVRVSCRSREKYELVYGKGTYPEKEFIEIKCQFGEFQDKFPHCEEILDDSCKTIKNGDISTTYGDIEVTCDTGYTSNTPKYVEIMCDDGKLKTKYGKHVKCVPDGCLLPDYLGYLQVTDYKNYKRGSMLSGTMELNHNHRILVYCYHSNHEPNNRILKCVKGEWKEDDRETWKMDKNTTFPECREAICEPKCQNSGTCVRDNKCKCLKENFGSHCEKFKCEEECVRNGGSCPNSNACVCPKYKSGKNCENDVCDPLCENSGTCLADNKCQCTKNTYGDRCEKFHCSDECVENGGSCPTSNDCVCPKEKFGKNCEIDVCNPECKNSGTCVKGNKCDCTDKTYGYRCEKFMCAKECTDNGGSCPNSNDCQCPNGRFGPNCQFSMCRQPVTNATLPKNKILYYKGELITQMTCNKGFKLSGDSTLTCREDGTWSGTVSCLEIQRLKYRVRVTTGISLTRGTNGDVYIKMYGEYGKTEETLLERDMDRKPNTFRPGTSDSFELYLHDVGQISQIEISLQGIGSWWVIEHISIYDYSRQQYYYFDFYTLISHGVSLVGRTYGATRCGAEFSKPVVMNVPDKLFKGGTRDVVECQMLCVEYTSSHCFGVVFQEASENCYILRFFGYNTMSPATSETRNNDTFYKRISCWG